MNSGLRLNIEKDTLEQRSFELVHQVYTAWETVSPIKELVPPMQKINERFNKLRRNEELAASGHRHADLNVVLDLVYEKQHK